MIFTAVAWYNRQLQAVLFKEIRQIVNARVRSLLVELILGTVWTQRTSRSGWPNPLILLLDECQNLGWTQDGMAIRILREGRKFGLAGWFSSQYLTSKTAQAALGQAALQVRFRPDDQDMLRLARSLSTSSGRTADEWVRVIRTLRVGQFLLSRGPGSCLVVTVSRR